MNGRIDLVCFGELLWDMLPSGKVAGGAPFNIVNRATALGTRSAVVSSIGKDALGDELLALVQQKGNDISFIQRHPDLPTSRVLIEVGSEGEPQYNIVYPVAWDDIRVNADLIDLVKGSKAFVYSSLGLRDKRSRDVLFDLLPLATQNICDINLREGHYEKDTIMRMIQEADILRTNEHELHMISSWLGLGGVSRKRQLESLVARFGYKMAIATLGGEGAVCFAAGQWYSQPVYKIKVADTVGAGDGFLAAFIYKYLDGLDDIAAILRYACAVGALTASKNGGTPDITAQEIEAMLSSHC